MTKYLIRFYKPIVYKACVVDCIGPFDTIGDAQQWHSANNQAEWPDAECIVMHTPD